MRNHLRPFLLPVLLRPPQALRSSLPLRPRFLRRLCRFPWLLAPPARCFLPSMRRCAWETRRCPSVAERVGCGVCVSVSGKYGCAQMHRNVGCPCGNGVQIIWRESFCTSEVRIGEHAISCSPHRRTHILATGFPDLTPEGLPMPEKSASGAWLRTESMWTPKKLREEVARIEMAR